jgi:hypothetical protein
MKPELIVRLNGTTGKFHVCVSDWPEKAEQLEKLYGPGRADGDRQRWILPVSAVSFQ